MDAQLKKALESHLKTLWDYQRSLFERGHTFWFCQGRDTEHNKPFYYYQINKSQQMATCSTCYSLMENRKHIRKIQRDLGLPLTPFYTNHQGETNFSVLLK